MEILLRALQCFSAMISVEGLRKSATGQYPRNKLSRNIA